MNDRYLFKAQHAHVLKSNSYLDGIWVKGYLVDERYIVSEKDGCEFLIDPKTICQCTGLKDKNGKLIWENDICDRKGPYPEIVKYRNGDWTLDYSYVSHKEIEVNYCNLGFYTEQRKCVEVIGNIFDNPELIERGGINENFNK